MQYYTVLRIPLESLGRLKQMREETGLNFGKLVRAALTKWQAKPRKLVARPVGRKNSTIIKCCIPDILKAKLEHWQIVAIICDEVENA